jgi:hypothetical protein
VAGGLLGLDLSTSKRCTGQRRTGGFKMTQDHGARDLALAEWRMVDGDRLRESSGQRSGRAAG